ncbi:MAG TPA: hypothetical protein VK824_10240, partial [Planctomycetota bacterium]|nr:hypothetical protein [Planctomycetota bacterium]
MSRTALLSIACLVLLALAGEIAASFTQAGNGAYFVEDKDLFIVRKPDLHGYTLGDGRWNECHINRQGLRGEDLPEPRPEGERW